MTDLYSKAVLTVIAIMLATIVYRMDRPVKVDPPITGIPVQVMR